jgi:hypothetical protein
MESMRETLDKIEQDRKDLDLQNNNHLKYEQSQELLQKKLRDHRSMFSILVEFLLLTDSHEMLFSQMMRATEEQLLDGNTFFLSCLEPFFPVRYVKFIPSDKLTMILEYYKSRKDAAFIQKMVFSLDHSRVETSSLMQICLKCGLMKSLAIICENGDIEDILTPIV